MRILHILDHSVPLQSGYSFRSLAILREQRALGWETLQLTTPRHGATEAAVEDIEGYRFHRTRVGPSFVSRVPSGVYVGEMAATARRIDELCDAFRPDVLQAHSPVLNALPALWIGRKRRLPVIYEVRALWEDAAVDHGKTTEESVRYRTSRALENFALRRADHITTICEGLRAEILSRGIASDRVTVIPNAVDGNELRVETMNDPVLRAQFGLEGKMVLGFAGSFYAYEGLDLLIDAIAMLAPRNPKLRVLLVGDGPQAGNLKAMVKERGLQNRVFFTGSVPHGDVRRYYGLIDILIYPRHRMRLTEIVTPLKPLEAMAYGRIFLASDVGGHRELVRDGETGFLFPAGDARALAHAIEKIIAEPALWPRVREQARRFVEKERTWSRSVARYADIYAALCAPAMARGSHLKHAGN